jgi:hypothetical protein
MTNPFIPLRLFYIMADSFFQYLHAVFNVEWGTGSHPVSTRDSKGQSEKRKEEDIAKSTEIVLDQFAEGDPWTRSRNLLPIWQAPQTSRPELDLWLQREHRQKQRSYCQIRNHQGH